MSDRYESPRWDDEPSDLPASDESVREALDEAESGADLEASSENVLGGWPAVDPLDVDDGAASDDEQAVDDEEPATVTEAAPEPVVLSDHVSASSQHAPGDLTVPPGYAVLEGEAKGESRRVGIVVARFNGDATTALLESALSELDARGVTPDSVTVMPVPGAFELPLAAMALAKTRRFSCIVALGCVIRGDTPHFDYVSSEAASGLQLAAIETGVPVAFGLLTLDRADQAESRYDKGAEAVRTGLEMADLFANLRAAASR
ncbi:6,7-dimethyl-8-ribityllumazine synthase [Gaiella sp.]|uniref:6,7-dimethyl-8-ribityllumazine synthase n=1 Tax=Gaiella sp. TaxID=2663207 RepID=UPI0032638C8A